MKGNRLLIGTLVLVVVGLYAVACSPTLSSPTSPGSAKKTFTEAEVGEIKAMLNGVNPGNYRIVLPTFQGGQVVDSETLGTLPLTEVQRIAASQNKQITEKGNIQAIFFEGCNGGGAGSHTESATPGSDLGERIEKILAAIDQSEYVFLR